MFSELFFFFCRLRIFLMLECTSERQFECLSEYPNVSVKIGFFLLAKMSFSHACQMWFQSVTLYGYLTSYFVHVQCNFI